MYRARCCDGIVNSFILYCIRLLIEAVTTTSTFGGLHQTDLIVILVTLSKRKKLTLTRQVACLVTFNELSHPEAPETQSADEALYEQT